MYIATFATSLQRRCGKDAFFESQRRGKRLLSIKKIGFKIFFFFFFKECTSSFMVPGCLANDNEELMNILFNKKQKDVLLALNKMLMDMSFDKDSPKASKISTRITAHSLEKGIQKFRDTESIETLCENSKNLQLIAAIVQALKSQKTSQIEFMISLEKLILQNLAVSRDSSSILSQVK